MTRPTIGLTESGFNSTSLHVNVGDIETEVTFRIHLSDAQLAYLAAQAVRIIENRALNGRLQAAEMKKQILDAMEDQ